MKTTICCGILQLSCHKNDFLSGIFRLNWELSLEVGEKVIKMSKKATLDPWVKVFKIFPEFQDFEVGLQ